MTIFDRIISGEIPSYPIWENEHFLAFLTPFANTPGQTVVIPKINHSDYVFDLNDDTYCDLMLAVKTVANLLEKAFDTPRIALVFEGTEVPHVHAKLFPMHGDLSVRNDALDFTETYRGYISTVEGPMMSSEELKKVQERIVGAKRVDNF